MAFISPNIYQLSGGGLHVTYSTTGIAGLPHFHYQDAFQTRDFTGPEIRTTKTEIGTLVTVTIRMTVDSGSTSFSLLVPVVNLTGPTDKEPVHTIGITTVHRFSVVAAFMKGQIESYSVTNLSGTAAHFLF